MPRAYAETSAVFSIVLDRTGDLYYVIHKSIVGKDVKTMTETPGYLKNLKKESVVQSVINCLTDAMRNKELKPGDKIPPEPDLAASLGVARSSVRDRKSTRLNSSHIH